MNPSDAAKHANPGVPIGHHSFNPIGSSSAPATAITTGSAVASPMYSDPVVHSVSVVCGQVEIVWRATPLFTYTVIGPNSRPPDKVWKEVWRVINGCLVREPDVIGTHRRGYEVPEEITFP